VFRELLSFSSLLAHFKHNSFMKLISNCEIPQRLSHLLPNPTKLQNETICHPSIARSTRNNLHKQLKVERKTIHFLGINNFTIWCRCSGKIVNGQPKTKGEKIGLKYANFRRSNKTESQRDTRTRGWTHNAVLFSRRMGKKTKRN
jgi:hypothetical protein